MEHRLVIADVNEIDLLTDYLRFWQKAFCGHELEEFCTTMILDQLPDGTPSRNERYYLLSDILPQDLHLRTELKCKNVQRALAQHQYELNDRTFKKECLYCRDIIEGLRSMYLEHLLTKHFLQLGKPENLVFVDELLAKVENNFDNLICLFCEKVFRDRPTLKEHMRKKGHKRINPKLKKYDRFFLQNYQMPENISRTTKATTNTCSDTKEFRRNRKNNNATQLRQHEIRKYRRNQNNHHEGPTEPQKSSDRLENWRQKPPQNDEKVQSLDREDVDSDSDWSDWDGVPQQSFNCFFCSYNYDDYRQLSEHLVEEHHFNLDKLLKSMNFYERIKLVNYIRRQMCLNRCLKCDERFPNVEKLREHLQDEEHFDIGNEKQWDKPEYFFPTYEDDDLLFVLDNLDDGDESNLNNDRDSLQSHSENNSSNNVPIYAEDSLPATINKDAQQLLLENINVLF